MREAFESWFEKREKSHIEDLFTFLKFQSVSTDPAFQGEMEACASWLEGYMRECGLEVERWETEGYPTLYGEVKSTEVERPTLLFYGHYDVQPPHPFEAWKSPPFEPVIREGAIFARGAIDNKGQGFYTLLALRAFLESSLASKINLKIILEGEEEVGSPGLMKIANEKKEKLKADHIFVVDLDMASPTRAAVTLGSRGLVTLNLTVKNGTTDLHSGLFGGIALNPARALCKALDKLWDERGVIQIPGFYDSIMRIPQEELQSLAWDLDQKQMRESFAFQTEESYSALEANWLRPSLEINGLTSGYQGKGVKTVIPSEAHVKLSARLVLGQKVEAILKGMEEFLIDHLPEGVELHFEKGDGAEAFVTSPHSLSARMAQEAYEPLFPSKPALKLSGATIPIVATLSRVCAGDLVMIGIALPDDNMHAPNEKIGLERFKKGFLSVTSILELFSTRRLSC